jgi:hypothetical protein
VIRPEILEQVRRELTNRVPAALWPLHWKRYALSRSEQDRLVHEDKFRDKWPSLIENSTYAVPPAANAEQASSEATAVWKATHMLSNCSGTLLDLTAGSGIDTWAFERAGFKVNCVEPDPYLVELLLWNGRSTGRTVHQCTAEDFETPPQSFNAVFVDPSRRETSGRRVDFSDLGEPNPLLNLETWLNWAPVVVLKLSPMLDRREVQRLIPNADLFVYLSRKREVKELLVRIPKDPTKVPAQLLAVDCDAFGTEMYRVQTSDARTTATEICAFIHDPDPVLRAAGAQETWASSLGYTAVHPSMSLYTSHSGRLEPGGRHFEVESVHNRVPSDLTSASIVTKNFPEKAEVLRQRLRIREDSERFLFAIQHGTSGLKTYIIARRIR